MNGRADETDSAVHSAKTQAPTKHYGDGEGKVCPGAQGGWVVQRASPKRGEGRASARETFMDFCPVCATRPEDSTGRWQGQCLNGAGGSTENQDRNVITIKTFTNCTNTLNSFKSIQLIERNEMISFM